MDSEIKVTVKPYGPTTEELAAIGERVVAQTKVRRMLGRGRSRLLYVEALRDEAAGKTKRPRPPERFRATIYDETNHRAVLVDGRIDEPRAVTVTESAVQPPPSAEEFAAALGILRRDSGLAGAVDEGGVEPHQPIPALHLEELPDGRFKRHIAVGLLARDGVTPLQMVAVDLSSRRVTVLDDPSRELGPRHVGPCGVTHSAGQATAVRGTAGEFQVKVTKAGQTIWSFLAVRPAASSGTNGSGVELRYVDYKGKRVLHRAHVPILNVKYNGNACGPYRDWQYQEGMIRADGVDVAPGFRICSSPPRTIMDTGSDSGTFLGVGLHTTPNEIVLVSEMEAGWYRYVSEWRLGTDGRISPRFGFAAVESSCVCNVHHHHVYWRFDFDVGTAANNRVREFNDPPLVGSSKWHTLQFEARRARRPNRNRRWRVVNTVSGDAYAIIPRHDDGLAAAMPDAPFGRGDLWVLQYKPGAEIEDGVVAVGPPYEAGIDAWVNGEPVHDHDVVVWYAGHFTHDTSVEDPAQHGHIVGPDLKPVSW
jgi:Copper amine oxidase, enzyme domain